MANLIVETKFPVPCGFSTRHGSLDTLISALHLTDFPLVRMHQIHSAGVTWVHTPPSLKDTTLPDTDAVLTTLPNLTLSVKTADCLPILLHHPEGVIGAVHAGRKGTQAGITQAVLVEALSCVQSPNGFSFWFGPAICKNCYQIDPITDLHFDLVEENKRQIATALPKKSYTVFYSNRCTACENATFFSYRKEKEKAGRLFGTICQKEDFYEKES